MLFEHDAMFKMMPSKHFKDFNDYCILAVFVDLVTLLVAY